MDLGIKGKVALVTGSARGIGEATLRMLAREGALAVVTDIDMDAVEQTVNSFHEEGLDAIGIPCDVNDELQVQAMVDRAVERYGAVDILVNNAGFNRDKYLTRMTEKDWDDVVDTILKGAFHCVRAASPGMMQRKWGRIVNISSRSIFGNPGQTNYATAKLGLIGFTRALSLEQAKFGVTVNAVAPGFVETDGMQANKNHEQLREAAIAKTPVGFLGVPSDIAAAVSFLASKHARYITGTTVFSTGGRFSS
jgi:3-oxoacyl-[acyl-carrier protein] reductase